MKAGSNLDLLLVAIASAMCMVLSVRISKVYGTNEWHATPLLHQPIVH